jgi:hypothetical protein
MGSPVKGRADYWSPDDWDAICSMCGRKRKASTMVRNWQGQYRCFEHNEPRQPQDYARGIPERIGSPWAQPPVDLLVNVCALQDRMSIPGYALPGCTVPGTPFNPGWLTVQIP